MAFSAALRAALDRRVPPSGVGLGALRAPRCRGALSAFGGRTRALARCAQATRDRTARATRGVGYAAVFVVSLRKLRFGECVSFLLRSDAIGALQVGRRA